MEALKIEYQTVEIETVMQYFASGFTADVRSCEYFIDTAKGKVVFKLTVAATPGTSEGEPE